MLRFLAFALPLAAAAQTIDAGIAANAFRTVAVPAETAVLELRVTTPPTAPMALVLDAIAPLGLKEEHLTSVSASGVALSDPQSFQGQRRDITYAFRMSGRAAAFRELVARLEEARNKVGDDIRQIDYSVYVGPGAKALDEARQAVLPGLYAEARAKAETLARAAGARLGALIWIAETGSDSFLAVPDARGSLITFGVSVRFAKE